MTATLLAFPARPVAAPAAVRPQPRYVSCAETAKLIRNTLRAAFPAVKFSVRSKVYSGGASVRVCWTDGPTTARVESVAGRFAGATFDGRDDSMSYHVSEDAAGQPVHYGANFVFCTREASDAHWADVANVVARYWGVLDIPARDVAGSVRIPEAGEYFGTLVHRAMADRRSVCKG